MWSPASAASIYSTVAPEFVAACVEDRGMEVVAAPAEGAEEGRRGGGGGVTDEVRTRDDDGAWMSVEDGGIEVVAAPAEVGAEECGRGGGGVTNTRLTSILRFGLYGV